MTDEKRKSSSSSMRTSKASAKSVKTSAQSKSGSTRNINGNGTSAQKVSSSNGKSSSRNVRKSNKSAKSGSSRVSDNSQNNIRFAERSADYRESRITNNIRVASGGAAAVSAKAATKSKSKPKAKLKVKEPFLGFDYSFFMIVIILLAFGLIMMFSASYATAYNEFGDSLYYLKKQLIFAIGGIAAMFLLSLIDYHIFQKKPIIILAVIFTVICMILVKVKPTEQGGAERWLTIGPITFQPSEILKFVVIILFAYFTEKNFSHLREFKKGLLPYAVVLVISCGLLMMQPHLSGTIIVFAIGFVMMFVAGVRPKYLIIMLAMVGVLLAIAIPTLNALGYDYFTSRWVSFVAPESDIGDTTFQTYQSLVTIGSGGLFGLGFGNSRQKYSYLPMARNDFIFSIVCEELGFVGGTLVILLFIILVWRGFYISARARDKFGMMLSFGIVFQIGLQALMNIAVVSNSMPNTGISLPFFSYGGSALLMQLGEMGVMLNISRKAELE